MIETDTKARVTSAFRWILGRQPDATGLEEYSKALSQGAITDDDMRSYLIDSPEFQRAHDEQVVVDIGEGVLVVVNGNEPEFGQVIASNGGWEPHIASIIRNALKPGDVFVDIGGNVGVMSMTAAKAVGPAGRVIAVEPNPQNVAQFLRGVLANNFQNVVLYPVAASDDFRVIATTLASNAKVVEAGSDLSGLNAVQAVPVDHLLLREERVDLLKIDIEGYELPALRGCAAALRKYRPKVICEFNPLCLKAQGGIEAKEFADFLFEFTSKIDILSNGGSATTVTSATDLMTLWVDHDAKAALAGHTKAGWLHFDLMFQVEPPKTNAISRLLRITK